MTLSPEARMRAEQQALEAREKEWAAETFRRARTDGMIDLGEFSRSDAKHIEAMLRRSPLFMPTEYVILSIPHKTGVNPTTIQVQVRAIAPATPEEKVARKVFRYPALAALAIAGMICTTSGNVTTCTREDGSVVICTTSGGTTICTE